MAEKFKLGNYFDFKSLNKDVKATSEAFAVLESQLQELAKAPQPKLVGTIKDIKENTKDIEKLAKVLESKQKLDSLTIQNEKLKQALEAQKAKDTKQATENQKQQNKIIKDGVDITKERNEQSKILNALVNEQLDKETRLAAQIELSKAKQKEYAKTVGKLSKEYVNETKKIEDLKGKLKEEQKQRKLNDKLNKEAADSIDALRTKKKLLEIQIGKLSKAEREETEEGRAMVEELANVNAEIIKFDKGVNDGRSNVGRYKEDILGAADSLNFLGGELDDITPLLSNMSTVFQKLSSDIKELNEEQDSNARKYGKIKAGLKGLAAVGVVGIIASVATYFTKSAAGAATLETKLTQLQLAIKPVIGYISNLGSVLVNWLQKQLLKTENRWDKFVLSLQNGANKIADLFGGEAFDTSELEKNITNTDAAIAELDEQTTNTSLSFQDLKDDIKAAYEEGERLAKIIINLRQQKREAELNSAELERQLELYSAIGEDDTKNFARRKKAQNETIKLNKEIADQNIAIAKQEIEAAQIRNSISQKAGLKDEENAEDLKNAKLGLIEAEKQYTATVRENGELRNKLISDEYELYIDINRDGYDNRKTINEQIIADDSKTFEERQKLLDKTVSDGESSFNREIEIIEEFRKKSIENDNETLQSQIDLFNSKSNLNKYEEAQLKEYQSQLAENNILINQEIDSKKLLATENEAELEQLIKNSGASEKFQIQLLTSIRDRRTAIQDLKQDQQDLNDEYVESAQNVYDVSNTVLDIIKGQKDSTGKLLITDKEYYAQKIELEKQLLTAQLERLTAVKDSDLTQAQQEEILELKKRLSELSAQSKETGAEIADSFDPINSVFKLLSENLTGSKEDLAKYEEYFKDAMQTIYESVIDTFTAIYDMQLDTLNDELDDIQDAIDTQEDIVDEQKDLMDEGKANSYETEKAKLEALEDAEAQKQEAIEETEEKQAKLAAAQIVLSEAVTAAKLIEAAASIFAANSGIPFVGVAIAAAAVASMIAAFVQVKAQLQGLHDGTEFVDGPSGYDNAGIFRLERGERVVDADNNSKIPKHVKNKDIPDLVNTALSIETMKTPTELLAVIEEKQPDNSESVNILKKMYQQGLNREEFHTINGRTAKIIFKNGKEYKRIFL